MTTNKQQPKTEIVSQRASQVALTDRLEASTSALQTVADECQSMLLQAGSDLRRAMITANGIQALRKAIDGEVLSRAMALMNTPLGFKTDRPNMKHKEPYDETTVRECLIWALLNGFRWHGNEFNIIAGNGYGALNGYQRKLNDVPGITDVRCSPGVPVAHNGQTVVRVAVSWKLDGVPGQLIGSDGKPGQAFPIITNQYASPDQLIGKARRKAYKMAFEQVTGTKQTEPDGEVGDPVEVPARVGTADALAARLEANSDRITLPTQKRLKDLSDDLELTEDAWLALCEDVGANPAAPTEKQGEAMIRKLEGQRANMEGMVGSRAGEVVE